MKNDPKYPLKEYIGFIRIGNQAGVRLSLWARTGEEALGPSRRRVRPRPRRVDLERGRCQSASVGREH